MPKDASTEKLRQYRGKRDFTKTPEPAGAESDSTVSDAPRFVVQKHRASHLHYDLRLEMEGVMRSWAVPKGPSLDPSVRRLAMEVEDHPISYNEFEGTIPAGEYGGGTVMLWDQGTYLPDEIRKGEKPEKALLRGYKQGKLSITLRGERLRGSFALVRTDTVKGGVRSKWLLLKHDDAEADPDRDITTEIETSVVTDRTMDEIAEGKGGGRTWRSNRSQSRESAGAVSAAGGRRLGAGSLLPMLATSGSSVPSSGEWTFEPKYDGIRVLAFATAESVALVTRNGNDKGAQFPEIVGELASLVASIGKPVVLDGEIVALEGAKIVRFENLQGRMHVRGGAKAARLAEESPAALIAFDILLNGEAARMELPWKERRADLEQVLGSRETTKLRLGETSTDHKALLKRGEREGWEGVMAKRVDSPYRLGQRTSDWLKLKLENQQEFVVGGWTEPRKSRPFLGSILVGYYDESGALVYAGHTGTGFKRDQLQALHAKLVKLERKTPPFSETPSTNERAHWTTPKVVVEIRFNEWTKEGKLRQPVFLGIREDKDAKEVVRESSAAGAEALEQKPLMENDAADPVPDEELDTAVTKKIRDLQQSGKGGELKLGRGSALNLSSFDKVFYPETGHTKGDLLLYYSRMGDFILPWMKDRPLVLKRFPNGVEGESFYQQAAPDPVPSGVRVETLHIEDKDQRRLVGGNLATLLYTIQLGAISFDPWHSRVQDLDSADYTILDLDPGPGVDFQGVVQVARWVKEELDRLGVHGALKTSGSSGLHIYLPLPRKTPLEAATLVAQIIATRVAQDHPEHATVERMTKNRPHGTVYVDYLQNILGKTVAGVYAVRAKSSPTVSTPLAWDELTDRLDLKEFSVDTVPARVHRVGDLWGPAMAKPNSLKALGGK